MPSAVIWKPPVTLSSLETACGSEVRRRRAMAVALSRSMSVVPSSSRIHWSLDTALRSSAASRAEEVAWRRPLAPRLESPE